MEGADGRAIWVKSDDQQSARFFEAICIGNDWCHFLEGNTHVRMIVVTGPDQFRNDPLCERRRDAEPNVVATAGVDHRQHLAVIDGDQRPAAVAGIDRRVGLDRVGDIIAGWRWDRPVDTADDSLGDSPFKIVRITDGQHRLTDGCRLVAERYRGCRLGDTLSGQRGQIAVWVDTENRTDAPLTFPESDGHLVGIPNDVSVGNDVTLVDQESGAASGCRFDEDDRVNGCLIDCRCARFWWGSVVAGFGCVCRW